MKKKCLMWAQSFGPHDNMLFSINLHAKWICLFIPGWSFYNSTIVIVTKCLHACSTAKPYFYLRRSNMAKKDLSFSIASSRPFIGVNARVLLAVTDLQQREENMLSSLWEKAHAGPEEAVPVVRTGPALPADWTWHQSAH